MRSYGHYCAIARALDVIGDRWTLLVLRELTLRPARFTDLKAGLPGVATNLLSERLRSLADAGLIASEDGRYTLTARGRETRPLLSALAQFGGPLMVDGPHEDDAQQAHWLPFAIESLYDGADAGDLEGLRVAVRVPGGGALMRVEDGAVIASAGAEQADVEIESRSLGDALRLLAGADAPEVGVRGDERRLRRLLTRARLGRPA